MGKITDANTRVTAPILEAGHGEHVVHAERAIDAVELLSPDHEAAVEHFHEVVATEHADVVTDIVYSNPLPSVLMLTAIVVGIATTALALALIVRIREDYGSIEEDEILELDKEL